LYFSELKKENLTTVYFSC